MHTSVIITVEGKKEKMKKEQGKDNKDEVEINSSDMATTCGINPLYINKLMNE